MAPDRRNVLAAGLVGTAGLMALAPEAKATAPARQIRPLRVKGLTIGEGAPKLIVSITEKTPAAALERSRRLAAMASVDMIEYRIDHLADHRDPETVAASVAEIGSSIAGKPLLMTFRTRPEGGQADIAPDAYAGLYGASLRKGGPDLIDLEHALCAQAAVASVLHQARSAGCPIVMSYHDFLGTPPVAAIVAKLRAMQALGADIPKIAVMPKDAGDVLNLLEATWQMHSRFADRPILTMSMGGQGALSRLSGEVFGSALTFGAVGNASAPGQIDADTLRPILDLLGGSIAKRGGSWAKG